MRFSTTFRRSTFFIVGRKEFGRRGYAQTRVAWYGKDERPGPSEIAAPGATLVDAGGGWRLHQNLELRALARNLLNDTYYASPDPRFGTRRGTFVQSYGRRAVLGKPTPNF